MKLCEDIDFIDLEYEKEIKQHKILINLDKLRKKKEKSSTDLKTIKDYERYEKAFFAIKAAKNKYCFKKNVRVNKSDLRLLNSVWKEEISKYHVGWLPKYKNILLAMKRILRKVESDE